MALSSYILEQALRQLRLPEGALRQFSIAQRLSDVDGRGFPRELFQLSAPVIVRGLLNFAIFQMRRSWIYPVWVHRQLDPDDISYVARSQNPVFVNTTHRNWTMLGSPHGRHEAIVDRHGLATPLPREWSLDVWLFTDEGMYAPSLSLPPVQEFATHAPILRTFHRAFEFELLQEHFVGSTNHLVDVLFQKIALRNDSIRRRQATLALCVRPFNPEGVAPIERIAMNGKRFIMVDGLLGLVMSSEPDSVLFSSGDSGDLSVMLRSQFGPGSTLRSDPAHLHSASCSVGLAHATALFDVDLEPGETWTTNASIALGDERMLKSMSARHTWRVSYERRIERHVSSWKTALETGAEFHLPDPELQSQLEANRLALLQLHDKDVITPGPFLYHHMWYRDASTMCRALDVLGYHDRVRSVVNGFKRGQTADGFYRGPDGEWDSNGAVLWLVRRHSELTRSQLWLRSLLPSLERAGKWIIHQRQRSRRSSNTHAGLMPPSLSAEHLGTVDQYYWDSLYSLAGLRALAEITRACGKLVEAEDWDREAALFSSDLQGSIREVGDRLGSALVPATPFRDFDESAIGSVAGVYPLAVHDISEPAFRTTLTLLRERYLREGGFLHPFIHSGYNPYLTLQLAHAELWLGHVERSWKIARTILDHSGAPYSLPEAIHPRTGGGSMGDGHHGWAAAEIVLFLRDCLVDDRDQNLNLLKGAGPLFSRGKIEIAVQRLPTRFGKITFHLSAATSAGAHFEFEPQYHTDQRPASILLHLPLVFRRVLPSTPSHLIEIDNSGRGSIVRFSSDIRSALLFP